MQAVTIQNSCVPVTVSLLCFGLGDSEEAGGGGRETLSTAPSSRLSPLPPSAFCGGSESIVWLFPLLPPAPSASGKSKKDAGMVGGGRRRREAKGGSHTVTVKVGGGLPRVDGKRRGGLARCAMWEARWEEARSAPGGEDAIAITERLEAACVGDRGLGSRGRLGGGCSGAGGHCRMNQRVHGQVASE